MNFYSAIKQVYNKSNKLWEKKTENPFFKAAGFNGAFEFLAESLIPKCQSDRNFSVEHQKKLMKLDTEYLITMSDIRSLDGKTARSNVKAFFNEYFTKDAPSSTEYYEF